MANADGQLHPHITLPSARCVAWLRNWDSSSGVNIHWYAHTIPNSQRHAEAAIANANANRYCDTPASGGNTCAKP